MRLFHVWAWRWFVPSDPGHSHSAPPPRPPPKKMWGQSWFMPTPASPCHTPDAQNFDSVKALWILSFVFVHRFEHQKLAYWPAFFKTWTFQNLLYHQLKNFWDLIVIRGLNWLGMKIFCWVNLIPLKLFYLKMTVDGGCIENFGNFMFEKQSKILIFSPQMGVHTMQNTRI